MKGPAVNFMVAYFFGLSRWIPFLIPVPTSDPFLSIGSPLLSTVYTKHAFVTHYVKTASEPFRVVVRTKSGTYHIIRGYYSQPKGSPHRVVMIMSPYLRSTPKWVPVHRYRSMTPFQRENTFTTPCRTSTVGRAALSRKTCPSA